MGIDAEDHGTNLIRILGKEREVNAIQFYKSVSLLLILLLVPDETFMETEFLLGNIAIYIVSSHQFNTW